MTTRETAARPARPAWQLAAVAALAAILAFWSLTAGAYSDHAYLNTATIGLQEPFDFVLVVEGRARHGPVSSPVYLEFDEPTNIIDPDGTLGLTVLIANNSPTVDALLSVSVKAESVAGGDIRPYMVYNVLVVYDDGGAIPICMNCTWDLTNGQLSGGEIQLGTLHARGAPPVGEGDRWSPGGPGSDFTLLMLATLVDEDPTLYDVANSQVDITVTFHARSVN
jgi:hypothetical protein